MATVSSRVQAVFSANSNGLVAGTRRASGAIKQLNATLNAMAADMRNTSQLVTARMFASLATGAVTAMNSIRGLAVKGFGELQGAVQKAVDLSEELSKSSIVFGEAAGQVESFARSAADIGLSTTAALQAAGAFGTLFRGMGQGEADAAKYSLTMTQLAADLASFNNASVQDAVGAIGAALRGESEPIRRFGVLLDDATLRQEALARGLTKDLKTALPPATRAMAAYNVIMRQTALAQGDFARTSDGLANLQRVIQAKASQTLTTVGDAFEPLFRSVTQAFGDILDSVGPFIGEVSRGIKEAMTIVGEAVTALVPYFQRFLGSIDGEGVGNRLREAFLDGAEFVARGFDYATALLTDAWRNSGEYIKSFGDIVGVFRTVAVSLQAVFYTGKMAFEAIAALLLDVGAKIADIISYMPTTLVGDGWEAAAKELRAQTDRMVDRGAESARRAVSAGWSVVSGEAGKAFENAMREPIGAAQGMIREFRRNGIRGIQDTAAATGRAAAAVVADAGNKAADAITNAKSLAVTADIRTVEGRAALTDMVSGAAGDREYRAAVRQIQLLETIANKPIYSAAVANI